jgi:DNA-binding NarL/FixJ family response regulator
MALIGILIVNRDRLVVDGLTALLAAEEDLKVLGQAGTVAEAVREITCLSPGVVIVDYRLPDGTAVDVGRAVRKNDPSAKVIFLTDDDSANARFAALEAGAVALIRKSNAAAELVDAIRNVADGNVLITPQSVTSILARYRQVEAQSEQITEREREVLRLLARGLASREIASRLGVSYATVRAHIYHMGKKLGTRSKLELVARAHSEELI